MDRRTFMAAIGTVGGGNFGAAAYGASSFSFAGKQLRFVVAYPAGGVADTTTRICVTDAARALGAASAIIENRPGANGNIGTAYVARQPPDGTTFLVVPSSQLTTNTFVPELRIKDIDVLSQIVPVVPLADTPLGLAIPGSSSIQNMEQFQEKARVGAIRFGNPGTGTPQHLAALMLEKATGLKFLHVPYKGGPPMVNDLAGGQIDAGFATISTAGALAASGRLRWLGTLAEPNSLFPGTPSLASVLKGASVPTWTGVFAPAGTPSEAMDAVNAAMLDSMRSPSVAARLREIGVDPLLLTRAQMQSKLRSEAEVMRDFLSRIKLDFTA